MREYLDPPTLFKPATYSQVVKRGNLIFISGQCATGPADTPSAPPGSRTIVGKGDPSVQARQCYQNVKAALEAAGASMRDVVKINTYSTHPDYRKVLLDLRSEFFEPPYPASTGVIVTSLFDPAVLFEVEAIAVVDGGRTGTMREHLDPPTIYKSAVYSQVVKAGNMIFVSGQCATTPGEDGPASTRNPTIVGKGDPHTQARQCYQNVKAALEAAGASMRDVVKINTYSTHPDYRKVLLDLRSEFFEPPYPASTGVVVTALFKPEALFEVEVIAIVDA